MAVVYDSIEISRFHGRYEDGLLIVLLKSTVVGSVRTDGRRPVSTAVAAVYRM